MATTPATLDSIDAKLEHVVAVFVQLADEQAKFFREQAEVAQQSNQRMDRLEETLTRNAAEANERLTGIEQMIANNARVSEQQARVAEQQARVAEQQAESVRILIQMLNQKQA